MTERSSLKDLVWPSSGQHAIEVMALAVEWERPISAEAIGSVAQMVRDDQKLRTLLPVEKKFPGFEVKIENQVASVVPNNVEIVDFVQEEADGKQAWTLSLRPEFFSCACSVYTRWADVKPIALGLLEDVASPIKKDDAKIAAFGMQYSDSFRWLRANNFVLPQLIRDGSDLLPPSAMKRSSLWHSHNGWYSRCKTGHRILNAVNVELVEENDYCVLRINGQHRIQAVSFENGDGQSLTLHDLDFAAEWLHAENKIALQNLLSDEALDLIGMKKVEEHDA